MQGEQARAGDAVPPKVQQENEEMRNAEWGERVGDLYVEMANVLAICDIARGAYAAYGVS